MKQEKIINIPNLLSAYRLAALPFITWMIIKGDKEVYITLLAINLVTDILDGWIARTFKLETEFGARLDSLADIGTYIMAFSGMLVLQKEFIQQYKILFICMIGLYATVQIVSLIRFKRTTSLHLYSSKILGYIQGIFIFALFNWGVPNWFFYSMIVCSFFAYTESLIIVLFIPALRSNVRGIYFMIKEHKRII